MFKALLLLVALSAAYKFHEPVLVKIGLKTVYQMPSVSFVDHQNGKHKMSSKTQGPIVIVPWIDNCRFSKRTLLEFEKVASESQYSRVKIFGIYMNPIQEAVFASHQSVVDSKLIQVRGQQDQKLAQSLFEEFFAKGAKPGDVFSIDQYGKLRHLNLRDSSDDHFSEDVSQLMSQVTL